MRKTKIEVAKNLLSSTLKIFANWLPLSLITVISTNNMWKVEVYFYLRQPAVNPSTVSLCVTFTRKFQMKNLATFLKFKIRFQEFIISFFFL